MSLNLKVSAAFDELRKKLVELHDSEPDLKKRYELSKAIMKDADETGKFFGRFLDELEKEANNNE